MLRLLFPFFSKYVTDNVRSVARRTKIQVICASIVGSALFFACFYLTLMIFFCLWELMSPIRAAAVMALIWFVVAVIGFIGLKIYNSERKPAIGKTIIEGNRNLMADAALNTVPGLLSLSSKSVRRVGLLAALATGTALACSLIREGNNKSR